MTRVILAGALCALAMTTVPQAGAQDTYPSRPIRLIMPFSAGGSADVVLRPLVTKLTSQLGQPVVIDNRPGALTVIGTQMVATAAPDGYTIGFISDAHSMNPLVNKSLPYDSFADFTPIAQLAGLPMVMVMNTSLGVKTVPDLVKYAKANPDKLSFASLGAGGPHHMLVEWFRSLTGVSMLHVPFPGAAPAITSILGGHVHLMLVGPGVALQHMKDKTLNALAVTSSRRLGVAPELPTFIESGLQGYEFSGWYGIIAPAKTPPEIANRLSQEIERALLSPDLRGSIESNGFVVAPSTPENFAAMLRRNAAFYEQLMKTAKVTRE